MLEPKVERKIDGKDEIIQRLSQQLLQLKEDSSKLEYNITHELRLRQAQEIQRIQLDYLEKERAILESIRSKENRSLDLILALLKIKTKQDRLLLAISWFAAGIVAIICIKGHVHTMPSAILTVASLIGFIGAIIFFDKNLKLDSANLKLVTGEVAPSDLAWNKDDAKPSRFFIFGFISTILMGLALYINIPVKSPIPTPTPQPSVTKSQELEIPVKATVPTTVNQTPVETKKVEAIKPVAVKKEAGNSGVFVHGYLKG